MNIPHKIVSMEVAVKSYKQGKNIGIIDRVYESSGRVLLMDKHNNFTTDFDYLINSDWVVFE